MCIRDRFNVLPLLPLDGGHAAVAIYEGIGSKIKGRPVVANFKKLIPIATIVIGAFAVLALSSIWSVSYTHLTLPTSDLV